MKYNFNIIIKKTNRTRTVSFLVKNQELIMSVPRFISDNEIDRLISTKINWINKKLTSEKHNNYLTKKNFIAGEKFMFFGKIYTLKIEKRLIQNINIIANNIIISLIDVKNHSNIKNIIRDWYIQEAKKYWLPFHNPTDNDKPIETKIQASWDLPGCKQSIQSLINGAESLSNKARFLAISQENSSDWLQALPSASLGLKLNNRHFRIACALRLGSKICHQHQCVCGKMVSTDGTHDLSCQKSSSRHPFHGNVNDLLK